MFAYYFIGGRCAFSGDQTIITLSFLNSNLSIPETISLFNLHPHKFVAPFIIGETKLSFNSSGGFYVGPIAVDYTPSLNMT